MIYPPTNYLLTLLRNDLPNTLTCVLMKKTTRENKNNTAVYLVGKKLTPITSKVEEVKFFDTLNNSCSSIYHLVGEKYKIIERN